MIKNSSMNRMHNITNPYQGNVKKVLAVCSAGLLRSPTTANVLYEKYGYNTRAAGLDVDHALIPVDEALIEWADEVLVMDKFMAEEIREFSENALIVNLGINDAYAWMDEELQKMILKSYSDYLMLNTHYKVKNNV